MRDLFRIACLLLNFFALCFPEQLQLDRRTFSIKPTLFTRLPSPSRFYLQHMVQIFVPASYYLHWMRAALVRSRGVVHTFRDLQRVLCAGGVAQL